MMKSKRTIPILFILILSLFPIPPFVESVGYGEENENLGQFTDDFENDDNVSVAYQVINNLTLDCMELNYSGQKPDYENFTDYTEVDTNNKITVFEDRIEFIQLRRDDEGYVYYDYGVDFWDDFEIEFILKINDTEAGDVDNRWINSALVITTYIGDFGSKPGDYDAIHVFIRDDGANDDKFKISLWWFEFGVGGNEFIGTIRDVSDNEIYCRLNRTGDNIYWWVSLLPDFSIMDEQKNWTATGFTEPMRYIYGVQSLDSVVDGDIWMSGYVKNLWSGNTSGGYFTDGYFITEDYLNYTTGQGLALLTNASIPYGTSMTAQFSNDNATWVDNEGNAGSTPVLDGFYAIDLRDLNYTDSFKMFNLTTTDSTITPRLYQSREITTNGTAGGGPGTTVTVESFFWIPIAIVLSIIAGLLVWLQYEHN